MNSDIELAKVLLEPRTISQLVRLWWMCQHIPGKQKASTTTTFGIRRLKKYIDYLRDEKIVEFNNQLVVASFIPPFPSKAFDNFAFRGMLYPAGSPSFPTVTNIAITNRCPMHCWHCSYANHSQTPDLSTEDWIKIIAELQRLNVIFLCFTGGEPLLRDDLEKISQSIDSRSVVGLATTGLGLSRERALSLKNAGVYYVYVSIDHHDPNIHDKRRGFNGAFNAAVQAIGSARSAGLYTVIQTVFERSSIYNGDFWKMLALAKELGVQEVRATGIKPIGRLLGKENLALNRQEELDFVELGRQANRMKGFPKVNIFEDYESPQKHGCAAGSQHSYIDAQGNVYPCDFVPLCFGNAKDESFEIAWGRVRQVLGKVRRTCLARAAANHIAEKKPTMLPLPLPESIEICEKCKTNELPDFFLN